MIDSILTAVQQPFFLRSLVIVILLACVFPLYGNIVVVREEANISHTFAHIGLLGVAVGLRFDRSIELSILGSIIVTVAFLYFTGLKQGSNHVAHNEIGAQFGLVGAILLVSQMSGYKADLTSYLFGDILLLGKSDVTMILAIVILVSLVYLYFGKRWYAAALDRNIAISKGIPISWGYSIYLLALGLLIGGAMQIIGVLLVSAFLILPSNIGKILAKTKLQRVGYSILVGVSSSTIALFLSWYLDIPSGASIIVTMLVLYVLIRLLIRK